MLLRYPITSYGSHHVELTGGLLLKLEDFIISKIETYLDERRQMNELNAMSDLELRDLGLCRSDIVAVVKHGYTPRDL